jgi:transposase-like protein
MAVVHVQCPQCQSIAVVKYGKQANGTPRYRCQNRACARRLFLLTYHDQGRLPAVPQQIADMTLNGSGVRDIVRVLGVSAATVIATLNKRRPGSSPSIRPLERRSQRSMRGVARGRGSREHSTKCVVLWATKTRRGGYGTRSITTQAAS